MNAERGRRLIWHGVLLFLAGLLTGFAIPAVTNPRLALSAHMEALLNGMVLVLLGGVVWKYLGLSERLEKLIFWLFLYAAYANWFFCLLAGIFGGNKTLAIASGSYSIPAWQEIPVSVGLGVGALSITLATVVVLYGLRSGTCAAR